MKMGDDQMMDFISKGTFIRHCFETVPLAELFLDE